jgi:hypothetical protein
VGKPVIGTYKGNEEECWSKRRRWEFRDFITLTQNFCIGGFKHIILNCPSTTQMEDGM